MKFEINSPNYSQKKGWKMKFGQKNRDRDNDDKEVGCFQYLYSQYVSLYDGLPGYGVATADCSCAQPAKYLQGGKITCIHKNQLL